MRESHPPTHVTHWSCDHLIFIKKSFISTFARTMATNFSKVWLKLNWPQPSSYVTHISCDQIIFAKRGISSFTTFTCRVVGYGKGAPTTLSSKLSITWSRTFWKTPCIHSAGDTKQRKTDKSKAFFVLQIELKFDS